ncbi:MAG: signal peptidase II [Alphaproteobacteria bacterium]|nr:signal peptidase II [Alphaproteobacteria bacterium]
MSKKIHALPLGLSLAALVLIADQISKWWIVEKVMQPSHVFEVTSFFNVVLVLNRGVSFGIFNGNSPYNSVILATLALGIALALVWWLRKVTDLATMTALGLVTGGAVGNAVDRIRHDAVIDFLDFHAGTLHWPAFNVADMAVSVGAAVLIIDALFQRPGPDKNPV